MHMEAAVLHSLTHYSGHICTYQTDTHKGGFLCISAAHPPCRGRLVLEKAPIALREFNCVDGRKRVARRSKQAPLSIYTTCISQTYPPHCTFFDPTCPRHVLGGYQSRVPKSTGLVPKYIYRTERPGFWRLFVIASQVCL